MTMPTTAPVSPRIFAGSILGEMTYHPSTPWPAKDALIRVVAIWIGVPLLSGFCMGVWGGLTREPDLYLRAYPAVLTLIGTQLVFLWLSLRMAQARGGNVIEVLALRPPRGGTLAYLLVPLVLVILARLALVTIIQLFGAPAIQSVATNPVFQVHWALGFFLLVILAPIAEEMLFRGFLVSALAQGRLGFWGASAVSSLLWSLAHFDGGIIIAGWILLFGMLMSYALWRTGSLRVCIMTHALNNLIVFIAAVGAGRF